VVRHEVVRKNCERLVSRGTSEWHERVLNGGRQNERRLAVSCAKRQEIAYGPR
jgi:hypothetical protein